MRRTGIVDLPLHGGSAPRWLYRRMVYLSKEILEVLILERGEAEVLRRFADPWWFQAFSCVLGFDWHSSGTTTVVMAAVRDSCRELEGIRVAGGKGKTSRKTPEMLMQIGRELDIDPQPLIRSSYLSAKVDNALLQDGYQLYHHTMIVTEEGWAVVQQGLSENGWARRYHWLGSEDLDFVNEPHSGISGIPMDKVLNMTASESELTRKTSVDIVMEGPDRLKRNVVKDIRGQRLLDEYAGTPHVVLPLDVNWNAIRKAYDVGVSDYTDLISIKGVGASTVRALALISELLYGAPPSWRDPVKYTFAVGGKDGVPYPVNRKTMDEAIQFLEEGIERAKIGKREKLDALNRLRRLLPG